MEGQSGEYGVHLHGHARRRHQHRDQRQLGSDGQRRQSRGGVGLCRCGASFGHGEFCGGRDQQDDHRQCRWSDTVVESNEGFTVTLSNPAASTTIEHGHRQWHDPATIEASATSQAIRRSAGATSADRGRSIRSTAVHLHGHARRQHQPIATGASWAVTGQRRLNPAAVGSDFAGAALPSGTVSFAAGETSKTITVNVAADTVVEPDEGFTVTLSSPGRQHDYRHGHRQWHHPCSNDNDRDGGRNRSGPGGQQVLPARRRWQRAITQVRRFRRSSPASSGPGHRSERRRSAAATRLSGRTAAPTSTSSGPSTATATGRASPTWSPALRMRCRSQEATLQQDFNHDGTTGFATTTIETAGATDLDQVGNKFFLHDGAGNGHPSSMPVQTFSPPASSGTWTPLGAEKVGSGYQLVWKNGSADQYIVWTVDSNGNWKSRSDVVSRLFVCVAVAGGARSSRISTTTARPASKRQRSRRRARPDLDQVGQQVLPA